jgi:hypothetical protein
MFLDNINSETTTFNNNKTMSKTVLGTDSAAAKIRPKNTRN